MFYDWKKDKKTTEICRSIGSYPFICSYDAEGNLRRAQAEYKVKSLLDLGCGRGNVIESALAAGFDLADGVEYFNSHISAARRRLRKYEKSRYTIYQGDIRIWQPKRSYDLIYIFDPIFQDNSRKLFFDNLLEYLPENQLVIYISVNPERIHKLLTDHFEHASEKDDLPLFKYYQTPLPDRNIFWKDK